MALSADAVVDAALRILADYGMGDLSMRRLARELDVQPSALYWHIADKQELFALIGARIAAEADSAVSSPLTAGEGRGEGAEAGSPVAAASALREVVLRYRDGAEIFSLACAVRGDDVVPEALRRTVIDADLRAAVLSFVLGCAALEQNRRSLAEVAGTAAVDGSSGEGDSSAESAFALGLSRLLAH